MKIDMHVHTNYSDGEFNPIEILNICKTNDLNVVAITDHNNIEGAKKAYYNNPYNNLIVIPGIEFSARCEPHKQIHILGYNIDLENKNINQIVKLIMEDSLRKIKSLLEQLKINYNISFKDEDLEKVFSCKGNIGRPEIAKLCVKYGYSKSVKDAFTYLFEPIADKVVKRKVALEDIECIKYITEASGIACLAHPITIKKDIFDTKKYIQNLANHGLSAIEVYHSKHSLDYSKELEKIAKEYSLLISGGSDYHGPIVKPNIEIGKAQNIDLTDTKITIINKILR